jgi:hypothetical protein
MIPTIRTCLAAAFATISISAPWTPADAADTTVVAYARVERIPLGFIRKDITADLAVTECTTPQEDMECTTGN